MSDIIERAEAALRADCAGRRDLVLELVAALKAARAENERLKGIIDAHHDGCF